MKFSYKNIYSKSVMVGDIAFYPQQERIYEKRRANLEKAVKDGVLSLSIDGQPPHPTIPVIPPPPDLSELPAAVEQLSQQVTTVQGSIAQVKSDVDTLKANQGGASIEGKVNPDPNSIPQRTATGTLKVNTAVEENEATTLKQVTKHVDSKVQSLKTTLTQDIQTAKTESIHAAENRVQALVNGTPDEFDTLKKLADALKEDKISIQSINTTLSERYTKSETDAKIDEKADTKIEKLFEGITEDEYKTIPKIVEKVKSHDADIATRVDQNVMNTALEAMKTSIVGGASAGFSTLKGVETIVKKIDSEVTAVSLSHGSRCPIYPLYCFDSLVATTETIFQASDRSFTGNEETLCNLIDHGGKVICIEAESKRTSNSNDTCFLELQLYARSKLIFDTKSDFNTENLLDESAPVKKIYKILLPTKSGSLILKATGQSSSGSVSVKATIKITKVTSGVAVNGMGYPHGKTTPGVDQAREPKIGDFFHFYKNNLVYDPIEITPGKSWSHSRWFRIEPIQKSKDDCYLWEYGDADGCYCSKNIGSLSEPILNLYSKLMDSQGHKNRYSTGVIRNFELGKWYHLVVMRWLTRDTLKTFAFLNGEKVVNHVEEDLDIAKNQPLASGFCEMGRMRTDKVTWMYGDQANILFFNRILTTEEVSWLYHNPVYTAKTYSVTDYRLDEYMKTHP